MTGDTTGDRRPSSTRTIRRSALQMLRQIQVDAPLDIASLCRRLGDHRGRPIRLVPYNFPSTTVFGLWVETTDADLIFFEGETVPEHQRHIILHEVGHMVLGHRSDTDDDSIWREMVPNLPPDVVRKALRRASYEAAAEHDAEAFASLLSSWLSEYVAISPGNPRAARNALEEAFDSPRGWA